jgi:hypothetical protein
LKCSFRGQAEVLVKDEKHLDKPPTPKRAGLIGSSLALGKAQRTPCPYRGVHPKEVRFCYFFKVILIKSSTILNFSGCTPL